MTDLSPNFTSSDPSWFQKNLTLKWTQESRAINPESFSAPVSHRAEFSPYIPTNFTWPSTAWQQFEAHAGASTYISAFYNGTFIQFQDRSACPACVLILRKLVNVFTFDLCRFSLGKLGILCLQITSGYFRDKGKKISIHCYFFYFIYLAGGILCISFAPVEDICYLKC